MNKISVQTILIVVICLALARYFFSVGALPSVSLPAVEKSEPVPGPNDAFCLAGCPMGAPADDEVVVHHVLELSNNPRTKFADWVAYKISSDTLGQGCKRVWKVDPDVPPDDTLEPSDYKGMREALQSDRGHQAPLASLCGSPYWYEADYLTNITPQKSDLNEGEWERLENAERRLVIDGVSSNVFSITGPLYEHPMDGLPNARTAHRVPSGYWKIVSIEIEGKIESAAFAMDQNDAKDGDFCEDQTSIGAIQTRAHLSFFPMVPQDEKKKIDGGSSEVLRALGC